MEDERVKKRLGGQVFTSGGLAVWSIHDEVHKLIQDTERAKVVDVLNDVFPQIQEFVTSKLPSAEPSPTMNGHHAAEPSTAPLAISA